MTSPDPVVVADVPINNVFAPIDNVPFKVKAPLTVRLVEPVTVPPAIVRLVRDDVPDRVSVEPLFIVIVPVGLKVDPVPTSNVPETLKLLDDVTVPDPVVRLKKVNALELEIEEPPFMVTVPAEAVNVPLPPMVRAVTTEKLDDVEVVPLMTSVANSNVAEFAMVEVPVIVTVPLVAVRFPPPPTVRSVLTE